MIRNNEKLTDHDVFCLHCGFLIDDYYKNLKCPECGSDLEGEAKQLMIDFKACLDKNNLVCIGNKIVDQGEEMKLELEIKEHIEQYNVQIEEKARQKELATMDVKKVMKNFMNL